MYNHGFDFVNGEIVQTLAADSISLKKLPEKLIINPDFSPPSIDYSNIIAYKIESEIPKLMELNRIFAYNTTTDKYTVSPDINDINTERIPIPIETKKHNWINGASPRFGQSWRLIE